MALPTKITPDFIKDSFIELRYKADVPFEIIIGVFYTKMNANYEYLSPSFSGPSPNAWPMFFNDQIKCELRDSAFVFNCREKYTGWQTYSKEIENILKIIFELKIITQFQRVGVRYLNVFEEDIYSKLSIKYDFQIHDYKFKSRTIKAELIDQNYNITIQISDNAKLKTVENSVSLIDIDVRKDLPEKVSSEELLSHITQTKEKEKRIFFEMLTPDFINQLKPEYS